MNSKLFPPRWVFKNLCCFGTFVGALAFFGLDSVSSQQPFVLGPGTSQNQAFNSGGANPSGQSGFQPNAANQNNSLGGLPASDSAPKSSVQSNGFQQGFQNGFQSNQLKNPRVANNPNLDRANFGKDPVGQEFSPGKVVANVGGYPIFRGDVMADINQLIEMNMAAAPESIKAKQRELALPVAVSRAVEQKLLFVDAIRTLPDPAKLPELKQSIRDQFVDLRLPELLKNLKAKNPAEAEAKLRKLGTSLRQARESWVNGQLAGFFVRDKIDMNPEITHFEMLEYYNKNRQDYHVPAQVRWEQIMVRFDKFDSREEAWGKLGQLGNEVVYGANFVAVAKKSSHGFEADKGGYNDWTTKGSLVHEKVDEALFSLPTGRLSDRIESKLGFHIVRVIERKSEGFVPFNECYSKIKEKIKKEKQNESLKEYVEKIKKEIPVETFVGKPETKQPN